MPLSEIRIERKLEILPGNRIIVPGCEPPSDSTSQTLLQRWPCKQPWIALHDALAVIPGARVEYGINWYYQGWRQRWLVLPPCSQECCTICPDWYAILRQNARYEEPVTEKYDYCDVIGQGFCPSPGFQETPRPERDPYLPAGVSPYGQVGAPVSTYVPAWQRDDPHEKALLPHLKEGYPE